MQTNINPNDIIMLEKQYWKAMSENDIDAAVALTKFPCTVAGPKGVQKLNEEGYRKIMKSGNGDQYKDIELRNPEVEILNADTAMINYSVLWNGMKMLDVSTWVREGKKWVCVFHSENKIDVTH